MKRSTKYKIDMDYWVPKDELPKSEEMTMSDSGVLSFNCIPVPLPSGQREVMIRIVRGVCEWLKTNGGTKLEVTELEEEPENE